MSDRPTIEQVLAEPAGFQMDDWIAEFVIGNKYDSSDFSKDIADAWGVVEKMRELDPHWCPHVFWDDDDGLSPGYWVATFYYYGETQDEYRVCEAIADAAPLAICRVAVLAVLESE
jgi:hypothetical protein